MIAMTQRYAHLAPEYLAESIKVLDKVMAQFPSQLGKVVNLNP